MSDTLLLIDGNSIINRAYFGMAGRSSMTASDKTPTGALFAFLNMYYKYHQDLNPTNVLVCFDLKSPTFRHLQYKEYKATRKPMPEDLAIQIPILKELLDAMGIPRIEMAGFEADDLIGSAASYAESIGWHTFILSGDKDDLQLVSNNTTLLIPFTRNGGTITETFDPAAVEAKYRVHPTQFVELKALMGDPSDNIPGVRGIGEKGATELIAQYGSLEVLYDSIKEIKGSTAVKLAENREMAFLSRSLSTIKRDIDLSDTISRLHEKEPDENRMYDLFSRLGFRSFISKLNLTGKLPSETDGEAVDLIKNRKVINVHVNELSQKILSSELHKFPAWQTDIDGIIADSGIPASYFTESLTDIVGSVNQSFICFYPMTGSKALVDIGDQICYRLDSLDFPEFFEFVRLQGIRLVVFGFKQVLKSISTPVSDLLIFDLTVAGYLLDQADSDVSFDKLASRCLDREEYNPEYFGKDTAAVQQSLFDLPAAAEDDSVDMDKGKYALSVMHKIAASQYKLLMDRKEILLALYIEMPLVKILADMEQTGFLVDKLVLSELSADFQKQIDTMEARIYEHAGERFNINSPKQLGEILFNKLHLPSGKKSQNGFSTNADVLDMLYDKHPIIHEIMGYRELTKLRSTFLEGLAKSIDPQDNRVHTTFNQTLTTTGRLSSSNPNMQNIPIKTDSGREIRKAFIAKPGHLLIDADYSQIELRLLADFSGDEQMTDAFREYDDIHMRTAEEIFDLPRALITPAMRSAAKTINFSIVYGIGDYSLAKDLNITLAEAHLYIEEYHKKYPLVKPYLTKLLHKAYSDGFVETLFKRRRYINELKSENRNLRNFGERAAMNAPIQGTAADIIKIAMVLLDNKLKASACGARLVLQVHDELILEAPVGEADSAAAILKESMENAIKLSVPLIAEVKVKKNWYGND
ncbi:MAG: DNA polymerase I [Saccharofermentanales bacterium]